ncbi:hypothetical protein C1Y40_04545 [Mycobacterium talmoniae]|uniref:Outer membrane channel protein CpnT-like N-terminal domain-containing protein n=1 Tax=Mycobacterium talmoniae TaxID=1858794 RepID=A0A2S8BF82_9MYCO|nr:hypothetical protein C1Y40_04545 [Mycobacterium talmoniae]
MSVFSWLWNHLVTDEDYPQGDAGACKDQAKEWKDLADKLKEIKKHAESAQSTSLSGFIDGAYRDGLDQYFIDLLDNIDGMISNFELLADRLEHVGEEIRSTKIRFWTDVTLAALNLGAVFSGPALWATKYALQAVLKKMVGQAVKRIITKKLATTVAKKEIEKLTIKQALKTSAKGAVVAGGMMAGNDAIRQGVWIKAGVIDPQTGKKKEGFDLASTGRAGLSGLVMGGISSPISRFAAPKATNVGQQLAVHFGANYAGMLAGDGVAYQKWEPLQTAGVAGIFGAGGAASEHLMGRLADHNAAPPTPGRPGRQRRFIRRGRGQQIAMGSRPSQIRHRHSIRK